LDATFRETGILRRVISSLCMPRETEISLRTQSEISDRRGLAGIGTEERASAARGDATRRDAEGFAGQRRDE
jgi:hypothetical protein